MKVLLTMFVFLSFSFILSGCDNKKNENIGKTSNNENSINISRTSTESTETELASFSTPLKSGVANRIVNIKLTCGKINGYTLRNGETFSFCNTVGPASTSKGYQEADIFDKDGNKKKELGGRKLSN